MQKLVIFFTLVTICFCGKLSEELDGERAETCGIVNKPEKPSSNSPDDVAPWSIALHYKNFLASAILVSPRHVLSYSHSVIDTSDDSKKWKWADGSVVDINNCKASQMKIPKKLLKNYTVSISICHDPNRCGTHIVRSVVDGYYIGNCETGVVPFGLVLFEISSNVPQNEPFFTPVCIPAEKDPIQEKNEVRFDSLIYRNDTNPARKYIVTEQASIEKCNANEVKFVQSVCAKRKKCSNFWGGNLVKKIDERDTVVAVLYGSGRDCIEHYVSVGFFKDQLCSLAGICKTTVPVSASSIVSTQLIFFSTLFVFYF